MKAKKSKSVFPNRLRRLLIEHVWTVIVMALATILGLLILALVIKPRRTKKKAK